jgi:hypothetical protein
MILWKQFPTTNVEDEDSQGTAFVLVRWIRIRIGKMDPDPDLGGSKWPKKS